MGTSHRLIEVRHRRITAPAFGRLAYWRKLQRLLKTRCQAYWPLDEASGTTAYGRSMHTTPRNGAYPATGVTFGEAGPDGGKCIKLAGTGYVNIYSAELANSFSGARGTAAIWFKVEAAAWTDSANRQILQLRADSNNLVRIYKSTVANQLIMQYIAAGTQETFTLYMGATEWTHLAITWDKAAEQVKAYVNGWQVGITSTTLGVWAGSLTNGNMYLGSINTTPGNPWMGWLAHAQLWEVALTPIQVLSLASQFERLHPENGSSANAAAPLETPTSDELGTACHPDIVYSAAGWNGYKYWLAMSPYPGEARENPEILASNDGNSWEVPEGLANPIDPAPGGTDYNSDPDLILGPDNTLYCFYRQYDSVSGTASAIKVRSSADGVTWGNEVEAIAAPSGAWSPAVVWDGAQYVMYYVAANQDPRRIERRTAAAPGGPWSAAVICPINYPDGYPLGKEPWHMDVFMDGSRYVGLITMVSQGAIEYSSAKLYLAFSEDGFVWRIAPNPLLIPGDQGDWDDNRIYRATGLPRTGGGYDIWYSAQATAGAWHIGRTAISGV